MGNTLSSWGGMDFEVAHVAGVASCVPAYRHFPRIEFHLCGFLQLLEWLE